MSLSRIRIILFLNFFICCALFCEDRPYTDRPDVLTLDAAAAKGDLPPNWGRHKKGLMHFVAELMALYPKEPLYFLARDGEYAYDLARALHENDKKALEQFKLIAISRHMDKRSDEQKKPGKSDAARDKHPKTPNLVDYLDQEGISEKSLAKGRVVLVDTGFEGTIATLVQDHLPKEVRSNVLMHMVECDNGAFPSSRVYLTNGDRSVKNAKPLSKSAFYGDESSALTKVEDYVNDLEEFPHFGDAVRTFRRINGQLVPVASQGGEAEPDASQRIMKDLRHYGQQQENRAAFQTILGSMKALAEGARGERELTAAQIARHSQTLEENGVFGFIMDLKEAQMAGNVPVTEPALDSFWSRIPEKQPRLFANELPQKAKPKAKTKVEEAKAISVLEEGAGKTFEVGERFRIPNSERTFEVLQDMNGGRDRNVYKIRDDQGHLFVIKLSSNDSEKYLQKIQNEIERVANVREIGLEAPPINHQGPAWIMRDWREGTRGDAWLRDWQQRGLDKNDLGWRRLKELLTRSIERGRYIGKLDPEDMVWDGANWHIIDSGSTRDDLSRPEIAKRYIEKMGERWGDVVDAIDVCNAILAPLAQAVK
jgi:hypothetical protein